MSAPSLDIVLPCYNPQEGWAENIIRSFESLQRKLPDTAIRLIVVNDGSAKNIHEGVELLKAKIPGISLKGYAQNKGKGYAVREGVRGANAQVIIYTDIDFPYEEQGLLAMYDALRRNTCDIAIGVRDGNYYDNVPFARRIISRLLKSVIRHTLRTPTADTQAGLKGFNAAGRAVFLKTKTNRYLFDLEFVWLAAQEKQARISCVPVKVKGDVVFRKMHLSILFTEALNFMRIFLQSTFGKS